MNLKDYFCGLSMDERKLLIDQLSEKLNKSPVSIRSYINGHRKIQATHAYKIEETTKGHVSRHELRPDIYPKEAA